MQEFHHCYDFSLHEEEAHITTYDFFDQSFIEQPVTQNLSWAALLQVFSYMVSFTA